MKGLIYDIQHIGSTSVPGMVAKPIVDIAALAVQINDPSDFIAHLYKIGYIYYPDMSSIERLFFRKGFPVQFHLSITSIKHSYWKRQILFRDYLRSHPECSIKYSKLKKDILKSLPRSELKDLSRSKTYNIGKAPFILKVIELAAHD